jgi:hypothetical protein
MFPNEVDAEMIIKAWCAMVNIARPHEEGLEMEVCRLSFMNILWMLTWIGAVTQAVSRSNILFIDDCANCCSARDRNVVFWSQENPHFTQELEHNPPRAMTCAGVTSDHVIGPYFFNELMNTASNLAMLEMWLEPQLRHRGLKDDMWLQRNGTHTHILLSLCTAF